MSIQFPDTPPPTDGQIASISGQTWRYRSDINAWEKVSGALFAITGLLGVGASITLTGDGTLASPYVVGTTVIPDYIGPQYWSDLDESITIDASDGRQVFIEGLDDDVTLTITNLEDGEEMQIIIQQNASSAAVTVASATLTVVGDTSGIASLDLGDFAAISMVRAGNFLLLTTNTTIGGAP
jgi:hypothetical protein